MKVPFSKQPAQELHDLDEELEEDAATIFSSSTVESKVNETTSNDDIIEQTDNLAPLPMEWSNGVCGCVADPLAYKIVSVHLLVFQIMFILFYIFSNHFLSYHLFFRVTMVSHALFVQPAATGTQASFVLGT